jgi:hypothetical protein
MCRSSTQLPNNLSTLGQSIATSQPNKVGQMRFGVCYTDIGQGLRIMAFGVLFDFTGNSNVSKVIKAADMVKQPWFQEAINYTKPIDLFVVTGHNPVRTTVSSSTIGTVYSAIRKVRPDVPIQAFGGHTHIRDFVVYDNKATGLESGTHFFGKI